MPKVSLIMPVYNSGNFIAKSIISVLAQDYVDWELICVDDGSTDNSREVIESFADRRIKYIPQKHTGKPSCARNAGIKISRGEFIAFLDSDDLYFSNSLSERVKYFVENSKSVFLYTNCEMIDENGRKISENMTSYSGKNFHEGNCFKELFMGMFIPIMGTMIKKSLFGEIGLFNETLTGAEDYELFLRIASVSSIDYVDQTLAKCCFRPDSLTDDSLMMDLSVFYCLESVTKKIPDCIKKVGREKFNKRMYGAAFDIAYCYSKKNDVKNARKWLLECFKYRMNIKNIVKLLATFLPGGVH